MGAFARLAARIAWVSPEARMVHEEALRLMAEQWSEIEWRSANSMRPCALISALSHDLPKWDDKLESLGLSRLNVRISQSPGGNAPVEVTSFGIGSRDNLKAFAKAWRKKDSNAIGALLGYPPCCRRFFRQTIEQSGLGDPVWATATATQNAKVNGNTISIMASGEMNILLQRLGLRLIPHFPCAFDCEASLRQAHDFLRLHEERFPGAAADMLSMLNWPIGYSMCHGIAEIRTPVLKLVTYADPTAERFDLHWLGKSWPDEGAKGLSFPYNIAPSSVGGG